MIQIITDKNKINEVLTRGVEKIYPDKKSLEKLLLSGKRIRLYCGFDPSASSLHIGNAIQMKKLAEFQTLGHEVIFLIGDFTGMIGDPTDKAAVRKKMTRDEVLANAKNYQKQASAYLNFEGENAARVMYNSEWSDRINFRDLIEISSNFTVQQMIQRDMFQERIKDEKPIHLHEFLYPLAQAYDSVAMSVDLEVGGNDQMFNMMCGRDLMKVMSGKEKFVITTKLLVDPTGKKMGKTEGNIVSLDETPENMYGQIMSWPDGVIGVGFELCTNIPMDEVKKINKQLEGEKVNPRDLKMKLAFEVAKINYGEEKARGAEGHFVKVIQKKDAPDDVETRKLEIGPLGSTRDKNWKLVNLLAEVGLAGSKGEARRLIKQGGIKIGGEAVNDIDMEVEIPEQGLLLQRGKRRFLKVVRG